MARCVCCRSSEEGGLSASVRAVIVLGCALGLAFIFLLVAGIRYHNWLPMINLCFVVAVPIAVILSDATGPASLSLGYSEKRAAFANFGSCLFGLILMSLFGLPLVLLHTAALDTSSFGLWIASTVVIFVAAIYYWIVRAAQKASLGY